MKGGAVQPHLSLGGRLDVGVVRVAHDFVHFDHRPRGDAGEGRFAVVGKVTVHLPGLPEVHGAFDHHGCRPKRLGTETFLSLSIVFPKVELPYHRKYDSEGGG